MNYSEYNVALCGCVFIPGLGVLFDACAFPEGDYYFFICFFFFFQAHFCETVSSHVNWRHVLFFIKTCLCCINYIRIIYIMLLCLYSLSLSLSSSTQPTFKKASPCHCGYLGLWALGFCLCNSHCKRRYMNKGELKNEHCQCGRKEFRDLHCCFLNM